MQTTVDLHQLIAATGDAVIASDRDGAITLWNPAAERMFGYSETEALGRSLDLITPERFRQRHWDGYANSMATGTTRYGHTLLKVPATHKDGRAMSIAFTVCMVKDADGHVTAVVAVVRDETARFAEERALRKQLLELETQVAALKAAAAAAAGGAHGG